MKFRLLILLSCVAIGVNAEEIQPPKTSDTQPQKQQSQVEKTTPVEASESTDELPADLQALLASNPFGSPVKKQQQDTQKPENNFALTGISFVDGKWLFSVVDYAERTVYTLNLNGKISDELPFRVDFFDEETQSINLTNGISEYVLTLKTPDVPQAKTPQLQNNQSNKAQAQQQNMQRQQQARQAPRWNWTPQMQVQPLKSRRINRR